MKPQFVKILKPLYLLLLKVGINPRHILAFRYYGRYRSELKEFRRLGGVVTHNHAFLSDYEDQAGSAKGHYFHQDLLVSSYIFHDSPTRHIDVGSRIDGFVAHVASFRKIDVMDVRELGDVGHKNISFVRANLMNESTAQNNITDSISCLHAIEHFGLGRYGDPLDPNGHIKGFNNLLRMLKPGGTLYISFPIGMQNEVHFNAHRVFHPKDVFMWANSQSELELARFDYVDDAGSLHRDVDINSGSIDVNFGCGIYTFKKLS
jgi:hypothetical protein